jgi:hypothetical protein
VDDETVPVLSLDEVSVLDLTGDLEDDTETDPEMVDVFD